MVELLRNLVSRIEIVPTLQALLTPLIAIIATYIAWQQWKANELKLKLERYERRLLVYREVVKILNLITRDFDPKLDDLMDFRVAVAEAVFLFGPEIPQYIEEIISRGLNLGAAKEEYRTQNMLPDYDHNRVSREIDSGKRWVSKQLTIVEGHLVVAEKFKLYLDVSK